MGNIRLDLPLKYQKQNFGPNFVYRGLGADHECHTHFVPYRHLCRIIIGVRQILYLIESSKTVHFRLHHTLKRILCLVCSNTTVVRLQQDYCRTWKKMPTLARNWQWVMKKLTIVISISNNLRVKTFKRFCVISQLSYTSGGRSSDRPNFDNKVIENPI